MSSVGASFACGYRPAMYCRIAGFSLRSEPSSRRSYGASEEASGEK
jgi:hypothetical protein